MDWECLHDDSTWASLCTGISSWPANAGRGLGGSLTGISMSFWERFASAPGF